MTRWNDFNDADDQGSYDVIPSGTLVKVRMTIKPGGFDKPDMGWTGGYATCGDSGAVYLNAEFTVLEGTVRETQNLVADRYAQPQRARVGEHGAILCSGYSSVRQGDQGRRQHPASLQSPTAATFI